MVLNSFVETIIAVPMMVPTFGTDVKLENNSLSLPHVLAFLVRHNLV